MRPCIFTIRHPLYFYSFEALLLLLPLEVRILRTYISVGEKTTANQPALPSKSTSSRYILLVYSLTTIHYIHNMHRPSFLITDQSRYSRRNGSIRTRTNIIFVSPPHIERPLVHHISERLEMPVGCKSRTMGATFLHQRACKSEDECQVKYM